MSSYVMIEGFEYRELSDKAKRAVLEWLDSDPIEYEIDYENGERVMAYQYFVDLDDVEVQEHCSINEYLFNKYGEPIHQYILTEYKLNEEK